MEQKWSARSLPGLKITTYNSIPCTKVTSTWALPEHIVTIYKNNKEKVDKQYHYKYISYIRETTRHVAEKVIHTPTKLLVKWQATSEQ